VSFVSTFLTYLFSMIYNNLRNALFACLLLLIGFTSCRTDTAKTTEITLSGVHKIIVLDSTDAAKTIVKDDLEHFFDKIGNADIAVQLRNNTPLSKTHDEAVLAYKTALLKDVTSFTTSEIAFVQKAFIEAFQLCLKTSNRFFPEEIKLVKSHAKLYDGDMFYTRENTIVIPKQALAAGNYEEFLKTMLHEISHIVCRTHPSVKEQLYALIGFKRIEGQLVIPTGLAQRLITNPDGIEQNWVTTLSASDGKAVFAMPLTYVKNIELLPAKPDFMDYFGWNYFEVVPTADGKSLTVSTQGDRDQSTLDTRGINQLFQQNYNTPYIIHPDEIVADNFALLALSQKNPPILSPLTEGGKTLIQKMADVLR
jgi:hypothetical protein